MKIIGKFVKFCTGFLLLFAVVFAIQAAASEPFELHLIDVGQGQSVLIEADNHYMLIDGGGRDASSFVVSYIKQMRINSLDYIAVSHYDEDHMSGLIGALTVFGCNGILVPPYPGGGELYKSFAAAAVSNGGIVFHPECGMSFQLGNAVVEVVGPQRNDYDGDNDMSLVFRIIYGNTSYLITGDAEQISEMDMVNSGVQLSADVYVAGHHGSRTSSTDPFLDAVSPSYGMISCGTGNAYGHPTMETLQRFRQRGITMFRTDLQGTVIVYSDGDTIWFNVEPCDDWTPGSSTEQSVPGSTEQNDPDSFTEQGPITRMMPIYDNPSETDLNTDTPGNADTSEQLDISENQTIQYVCNTNTRKFHIPTCRSVDEIKPENRMDTDLSRDELIAEGYKPCKNCNP